MLKYGSPETGELRFKAFRSRVERRDEQWIDVELRFELEEGSALPDDVTDLTALVICTKKGDVFQVVPQDEGMDCEYQFTPSEKEQIIRYVEQELDVTALVKINQTHG
ncbi:hypothetical protein [Paenibacillus hamazuiensis]|uniref:hypothetical protein n=1 Tax=Paenibacillus hamazuiensis TaxID=2936508 RepID=UPI00200E5C16|nr:hypothetical protein [Paenibacillus hamazuiensis]